MTQNLFLYSKYVSIFLSLLKKIIFLIKNQYYTNSCDISKKIFIFDGVF